VHRHRIGVLDCLLAAAQGVRNYGLELGQTLHLVQDAAAIAVCEELAQEYLRRKGYADVFTPVTSLHWMGAWPHDEAQSAALIATAARSRRSAGAVSVTTKSTHEAHGIPTPQANAEGLRMTRMAIYLARGIRLDGLPEYEREKELIRARCARSSTACSSWATATPPSARCAPSRPACSTCPGRRTAAVKSRIVPGLPARDADGYLRILEQRIRADGGEQQDRRARNRKGTTSR
jgi:methylaspartate mutase epsilon subunit